MHAWATRVDAKRDAENELRLRLYREYNEDANRRHAEWVEWVAVVISSSGVSTTTKRDQA